MYMNSRNTALGADEDSNQWLKQLLENYSALKTEYDNIKSFQEKFAQYPDWEEKFQKRFSKSFGDFMDQSNIESKFLDVTRFVDVSKAQTDPFTKQQFNMGEGDINSLIWIMDPINEQFHSFLEDLEAANTTDEEEKAKEERIYSKDEIIKSESQDPTENVWRGSSYLDPSYYLKNSKGTRYKEKIDQAKKDYDYIKKTLSDREGDEYLKVFARTNFSTDINSFKNMMDDRWGEAAKAYYDVNDPSNQNKNGAAVILNNAKNFFATTADGMEGALSESHGKWTEKKMYRAGEQAEEEQKKEKNLINYATSTGEEDKGDKSRVSYLNKFYLAYSYMQGVDSSTFSEDSSLVDQYNSLIRKGNWIASVLGKSQAQEISRSELSALPAVMVFGAGLTAGVVAKYVIDVNEFKVRVDEYKRLREKGVSHEQAKEVIDTSSNKKMVTYAALGIGALLAISLVRK